MFFILQGYAQLVVSSLLPALTLTHLPVSGSQSAIFEIPAASPTVLRVSSITLDTAIITKQIEINVKQTFV